MDFAAAGLLDGLDGQERDAREQLLERLADEGLTAEGLPETRAREPLAWFRPPLAENVGGGVISRAELAAGHLAGEQEMVICFVDLVGFTALGSELDAHELGGVVGSFTELAADVAEPPVRLVKT